MGSEWSHKNLVVTQISVGGFENHVTAQKLAEYFEDNIGTVCRCRLKTSSTPLESFPAYDIDCKLPHKKIAVKKYQDFSGFKILLQLFSSPSIYYRTADDDIVVSVPWDLLDDDDPWIRTLDFTPSGAIGRCNTYRI